MSAHQHEGETLVAFLLLCHFPGREDPVAILRQRQSGQPLRYPGCRFPEDRMEFTCYAANLEGLTAACTKVFNADASRLLMLHLKRLPEIRVGKTTVLPYAHYISFADVVPDVVFHRVSKYVNNLFDVPADAKILVVSDDGSQHMEYAADENDFGGSMAEQEYKSFLGAFETFGLVPAKA